MTVKIQNASEINAQGIPRNRNAKPVICLDTGEVFTSARDAAESVGAHPSTMSWALTERQKTCKGKRYCYLSKVTEHLDELTDSIKTMSDKAKKYDELIARKDDEVKPEPTPTYVAPKAKTKPKSFGRKIIDMFAKRNIRTAM